MLLVCKLHGSVNYFQNHSLIDRGTLYIANDLGNEKPIWASSGFNNRPAVFAVDAIWNIQKKYGTTYFPAIIPPTYSKLTQQNWVKQIWNNAFKALCNSKKIVFIGYSMPMSDGFMRALIHGSMAFRKKGKPPTVYVIDPCKDTHQRYEDIFRSTCHLIVPIGFEEAVGNGLLEEILSAL